mgnify:FL=1
MLNKHGGKVRLTFKLESDQLWLSTKERTEKLPMGSIKSIVSESIEGHEEYHILVVDFRVITIIWFYFSGFAIRSYRSVKILDLLGACTICRRN